MTKKREEWMKYWMPKLSPWAEKSEKVETENQDKPTKHHLGFCPVTAIMVICMIGQLVLLKKHEHAVKNLEICKRAREILKNNDVQKFDVEQPAAFVPCPVKINDS